MRVLKTNLSTGVHLGNKVDEDIITVVEEIAKEMINSIEEAKSFIRQSLDKEICYEDGYYDNGYCKDDYYDNGYCKDSYDDYSIRDRYDRDDFDDFYVNDVYDEY